MEKLRILNGGMVEEERRARSDAPYLLRAEAERLKLGEELLAGFRSHERPQDQHVRSVRWKQAFEKAESGNAER